MSTPSPWEYFSVEELSCKCGCGQMKMNADFMDKAVKIRKFYNVPLIINSAYRCPEYDAKVGSSSEPGAGPHTMGRALDIGINGSDLYAFLACLFKLGLTTGIGLEQKPATPPLDRFCHIDDLKPGEFPKHFRPNIWTY